MPADRLALPFKKLSAAGRQLLRVAVQRAGMSNSQIAGPDTTQKHVQLLLIGVFTFLAGLYAAGGHMRLFVAMLAVPVIGSVLLAVGKPGETPRR